MKHSLLILFAILISGLNNLTAQNMNAVDQTVVDIVVESENHTTLEAAVIEYQ